MRLRRKKRSAPTDDINERWERDLARVAAIEADPTLTAEEKLHLQAVVMLGETSYAHLIPSIVDPKERKPA